MLHRADAQGKNDEGKAGVHQHERQNERAAFRINGKGMNAGQYPRPHEERACHRHGKSNQCKHDGPCAKRVTGGQYADRMQQGRGREPWQQRGILNGVPKPPTTPAQFIISPIAARRDADG